MKKYLETGLMIICAAAFFGFIYPELCLTTDTVKVVESNPTQENDRDPKKISNLYNDNQALTPTAIKIRFRFRDRITGLK